MSSKSRWGGLSALFIKQEEAPTRPVEPEPEPEEEDEYVSPSGMRLSTTAAVRGGVGGGSGGSWAAPGTSESLGTLSEGRPFEDIYRDAGVPLSNYPVEKLLAVLAGLANMHPDQIRMVVTAMDAADESWTIDDPVADAKAKVDALRSEKVRVADTAAQAEAQGRSNIDILDERLAETAASIKSQIETLQVQLQTAMSDTATSKAQIEADIRSAKESAVREGVRLDTEAGRLIRIPNTFGSGK